MEHKFTIIAIFLVIAGMVGLQLVDFDGVNSQSSITGAVVGSSTGELSLSSNLGIFASSCYSYNSESNCEANNCSWHTEGDNTWCENFNCFAADSTNQTYCENLNVTYSLDFSCEWENDSGEEECEPLGGDFHGDGCSDFDEDEEGCYSTKFCLWNSTGSECDEPEGGFGNEGPGNNGNPSCSIVRDIGTCGNITGCAWNNGACTGHALDGIHCSDVSEDLCSDVTFLSSCCNWNGTSCKASFSQECYNNIPSLPIGATYCEDVNAYNNQTNCETIAGSPWYMPCAWDNITSECHFNSDAFGGGEGATFDEISSESNCEAQGGVWKSEQWIDNSGSGNNNVQTDSWCEFDFGAQGNCDAACWACELDAGSAGAAQSACEGSDLGYCEYVSDSNAINGYGWCNPKQQFIDGGGKSCDSECSACDFLTSPESQCVGSVEGCSFVNDSSAQNGVGYCYGNSEKYCGNDCFSCYDENACQQEGDGGNGACGWDSGFFLCKPSGFSGEICFDGVDNDNDGNTDCADAGCATDKFCGGAALSDSFGDCPGFSGQGNETCINNGCVWLVDEFDEGFGGDGAGFCDFPGAQCWMNDDSEGNCNGESGCSWYTSESGFCGENDTMIDNCDQNANLTACDADNNCDWKAEAFHPSGGFCDTIPFVQCEMNQSRHASQSVCETNLTAAGVSQQACSWNTFENRCQVACFTQTNETCGTGITGGFCEVVAGFCEPDQFGGKCFEADGNITQCNDDLNSTCTYFPDTLIDNGLNGTFGNVSGWCDSKGDAQFVQFMGNAPPVILGEDGPDAGVSDLWDITGVGLKDDFDRMIFGVGVEDFSNASVCNGVPLQEGGQGSGTSNHSFFWYMDTDGNLTGSCAGRDNSSIDGFEFSFKYQGSWEGGQLTEKKVAYQCVDGSWGAAPIPMTSSKKIMCGMIGGGMAGVDKAEMMKFKTLFNKSEGIRIYVTVGNESTNDSDVVDTAGPYYYTHGSFDFKFEDCATPGADADGDGISASNDPDCFNFLKFGYVPNEIGFQCNDGVDNDADGDTDCSDEGCAYSFECGGSGIPAIDANDKTPPSIVWLKDDSYPDAAFVMYDTDEPANGTLSFYSNDSTCQTVNATIRDVGVFDDFLPDFKLWHDAPIDGFSFNSENIGYSLANGTAYYYKTTVCDINNNCRISACLNFTTKASADNCNGCTSTFNFPYSAPSGAEVTDPLGGLSFNFTLPDGSSVDLDGNADSGTQLNYSQTKNFNLHISNPNATSPWCLTLINASVNGKVSAGVLNFSSDDKDVGVNATATGTFVGFGDTKCQELINAFRPKRLQICVPGNNTDLYQCGSGLANCTKKNLGTNATRLEYDASMDVTRWEVPAEWGC